MERRIGNPPSRADHRPPRQTASGRFPEADPNDRELAAASGLALSSPAKYWHHVSDSPELRRWFDEARYRRIAADLAELHDGFDSKRFLAHVLDGLDERSLLQRLRRTSQAIRATLPGSFPKALAILQTLAPRVQHGFVSLVLPDFVGLYGLDDFDRSMDALKFFTPFGSSEFAVREFLRRDLHRTLAVMETWSRDPDEHVRRLASEGCRPRLPWSFKLRELISDPSPVRPILHNLRADPSLYVRKSVANHLNDITKDHPEWVLERLGEWDLTDQRTAWIAKRALRTLIKQGDRRALGVIGAGRKAAAAVESFTVAPKRLRLGDPITLSLRLKSTASVPQKLVIDYAIHYVKQSGATSEKVFKWKETVLAGGETLELSKRQPIRDFTTRKHHPGRHRVEVSVNGERLADAAFVLAPQRADR
jgi:3-methyladenine DNA glycosylase AlkC